MAERLVVIHNPNSSRARKVGCEVLGELNKAGVAFIPFETRSPKTEDNIADMRDVLREGDTVIVAAGDGTAMQSGNAILRNDFKHTKLGLLPYGNFNNLASIYGLTADSLLTATETDTLPTLPLHPITIEADGKYYRDALAYVTAGWTARAAREFSEPNTREAVTVTPDVIKLTKSLFQLAINYFAHRKEYLPPFHTSQSELVRQTVTDILAINNPVMGSIIRSEMPYGNIANTFGYHELDVSSLTKNIPWGIKALSGHTPSTPAEKMTLHFEQPSTVPIQSEGEFFNLTANEVTLTKDPSRRLTILVGSGAKVPRFSARLR